LLVARRTLKKLKLDTKYAGNKNINGEDFNVTPLDGDSRPFKAFLDVGLRRCSTGNKVFAAMKGAADGGIFVPHSVNRLVGYDTEGKKLKADILRKYIFGGHVQEHMEELQEEDPESYQTHYSRYIKNSLSADNLEESWKKVHDNIRANPEAVLTKKNPPKEQKRWRIAKLSTAERVKRVRSKKQSILSKNKAQE